MSFSWKSHQSDLAKAKIDHQPVIHSTIDVEHGRSMHYDVFCSKVAILLDKFISCKDGKACTLSFSEPEHVACFPEVEVVEEERKDGSADSMVSPVSSTLSWESRFTEEDHQLSSPAENDTVIMRSIPPRSYSKSTSNTPTKGSNKDGSSSFGFKLNRIASAVILGRRKSKASLLAPFGGNGSRAESLYSNGPEDQQRVSLCDNDSIRSTPGKKHSEAFKEQLIIARSWKQEGRISCNDRISIQSLQMEMWRNSHDQSPKQPQSSANSDDAACQSAPIASVSSSSVLQHWTQYGDYMF